MEKEQHQFGNDGIKWLVEQAENTSDPIYDVSNRYRIIGEYMTESAAGDQPSKRDPNSDELQTPVSSATWPFSDSL